MNIIQHLADAGRGKHPLRQKRSPHWGKFKKAYFKKYGKACEVCGRKSFVQLHHVIPFHVRPDLELMEWNVVGLCEPPHKVRKCHLIYGHLGDWRWFDPDVKEVAASVKKKIAEAREQREREKKAA